MALPILNNETLITLAENQLVLALCGWRSGSTDYTGLQPSSWESSENSWDNGDPSYARTALSDARRGYGKWLGPGAVWIYANNLTITGATLDDGGHDVIARIASGNSTTATWERTNAGFVNATGKWHVVLQDADGTSLHDGLQDAASFTVPALSRSAVLWVRLEQAERDWMLPSDYLEVTGQQRVPTEYMYSENGNDYIWDYVYDVGRRPEDTENPLYQKYFDAQQSGQLLHRGAWTQFISDATKQSGPWSALRIAVDSDPFAVESTFVPAPGSVVLDGNKDDVFVHETACSVACYADIPNGERIAGTIATTKGVAIAYWDWNSGAPDLIAVNYNIGTMVCESSLYPTPSDIIQLKDGTELVLTWSFLFRYDNTVTDITKHLIGVPANTAGHPGGRCLRSVDGVAARFFTEAFGAMGKVGETGFVQMYNTLRTLDTNETPKTGIGTAFHGNSCADVIWGQFWGWVQDGVWQNKNGEVLNPKQYLAFLRNEMWEASSIAPFDTTYQMWQRVARIAKPDGQKLICSGKERDGEAAIWGIHDGTKFQSVALDFRPRSFTPVTDENGDNWLYVIGRDVDGDDVKRQWKLIRLSGDIKKQCFIYDTDAFKAALTDVTAAGIDAGKLPAYLSWHAAATDGGGYWLPADEEPDTPYLALSNNGTVVSWTLSGTAPYDFEVWGCICVPVYSDGGIGHDAIIPDACSIENAGDALDVMPDGTKVIVIGKNVADAWDAMQVDDPNDIETSGYRTMEEQALVYPCLWARYDSTGDADDLSTYTHRIRFGRFISLPETATERVQVCMLVPPSAGTVKAQVIAQR